MRYTVLLVAVLALLALAADTGLSQNTASQSLSFTVSPIAEISVSGNPPPFVISNGTPGSDALSSVSDGSTTYSIVHNSAANLRITAVLDVALPAGFVLQAALASSKGTSSSAVTIPAGTAVDVVTGIARGADANRTITYTFSADASAGELPTTSRTVTLTLTN